MEFRSFFALDLWPRPEWARDWGQFHVENGRPMNRTMSRPACSGSVAKEFGPALARYW